MAGGRSAGSARVRVITVGGSITQRGCTVTRLRQLGLDVVPGHGSAAAPVDLVIVHLVDGGSTAAAVAASTGRARVPHVVISDSAPGTAELVSALAGGAQGWLTSDVSDEALTGAVTDVLAGSIALSRSDVGVVVAELRRRSARSLTRADGRTVQLSDREWDVLDALAAGASGADVATTLGVDQATVRGYVASAVRRLRVNGRAEAVALFRAEVGGPRP